MKEKTNENNLENLFKKHQEFSLKMFPKSTWKSSLIGLQREIKEVEFAKDDYTVIDCAENKKALGYEYIDCLMYLLDSMKRAGFDASEIHDLFSEKYQINLKRTWVKDSDGCYSHVK